LVDLAVAVLNRLFELQSLPSLCIGIAFLEATVARIGFFEEGGQFLAFCLCHELPFVRHVAFAALFDQRVPLLGFITSNFPQLLEILTAWQVQDRSSPFPLDMLGRLVVADQAILEHAGLILETALIFLREGNAAEMLSALVLMRHLLYVGCPLLLHNPLAVLELLVPFLDRRGDELRASAFQVLSQLTLMGPAEALPELISRCFGQIESVVEARFLLVVLTRHGASAHVRQFGRERLPAVIAAAEAAARDSEPQEVLLAFQVIGTAMTIYGEELDAAWPLFMSLADLLIEYGFPDFIYQIGAIFQGVPLEDNVEHAKDIELRMGRLFEILLTTSSPDHRFAVLRSFLEYAEMAPYVGALGRVSKWFLLHATTVVQDPKAALTEQRLFLKLGFHLLKKVVEMYKLPVLRDKFTEFAVLGLTLPDPQFRAMSVRLLDFLHRLCSVPYEENSVRAVIEFVAQDCDQVALAGAKFLFDMRGVNEALFGEIGGAIGSAICGRLVADPSAKLKDYLIGTLVDIPENDGVAELIVANLPNVAAGAVFDRVFRWIVRQWQRGIDDPAVINVFVEAIVALFSTDIQELVEVSNLSREVLPDLLAILETAREVVERTVQETEARSRFQAQIDAALAFVSA
jgi:hypothetical protein